jgi:hypothetical protein
MAKCHKFSVAVLGARNQRKRLIPSGSLSLIAAEFATGKFRLEGGDRLAQAPSPRPRKRPTPPRFVTAVRFRKGHSTGRFGGADSAGFDDQQHLRNEECRRLELLRQSRSREAFHRFVRDCVDPRLRQAFGARKTPPTEKAHDEAAENQKKQRNSS